MKSYLLVFFFLCFSTPVQAQWGNHGVYQAPHPHESMPSRYGYGDDDTGYYHAPSHHHGYHGHYGHPGYGHPSYGSYGGGAGYYRFSRRETITPQPQPQQKEHNPTITVTYGPTTGAGQAAFYGPTTTVTQDASDGWMQAYSLDPAIAALKRSNKIALENNKLLEKLILVQQQKQQ